MNTLITETSFDLKLTQIAWVVKDIHATLRFFKDVLGVDNFSEPGTVRAEEYEATYCGKPADGETLVSMAYTGGTFIEIVQPVSGYDMFRDYIDKNPAGGVQHIAYGLPVADLAKVISELTGKGYPVISTYDTSIAKIVFFDTYKELGVATEIMGITKEGEKIVEKMKGE